MKKDRLIELEKKLNFEFPDSWLYKEYTYLTYEEFLNIPKTEEQQKRLDRMFRNSDDEETAYYQNTEYLHENGFITPIETFTNVKYGVHLKNGSIYYRVKPYDELFLVVYGDTVSKIKLNSDTIRFVVNCEIISYDEFYTVYKDFR